MDVGSPEGVGWEREREGSFGMLMVDLFDWLVGWLGGTGVV